MMMNRLTRLLFLAAILCTAPAVQAVELISNLDGNDGSQSADLDDLRSKGMGFTMPAGDDYFLDSATLRLETFGDNIAPIVEIWNDVGGVPSAPLVTLSNPAFASSGIANYDFTPPASFTLAAGTTYWLVAYGTATADRYDWKASSPGVTPTGFATDAGAVFDTDGAPPTNTSSIINSYAINGTLVPEPGVGMLLGAGLIGLALKRRRG